MRASISARGPLILAIVFYLAGCASPARFAAQGAFLGDRIVTTLDSAAAAYYLEHYLAGQRTNPDLDAAIDALHVSAPKDRLPNRTELATIAAAYSTDFAALFFADRVQRRPADLDLHKRFQHHLSHPAEDGQDIIHGYTRYVVLFAPGWDYRSNGHVTGADLARPRELVSALGLECHLVSYAPNGSVEANARDIVEAVEATKTSGKRVILVGASSAGPAIHLALSNIAAKAGPSPAAWINLGGILHGSPLLEFVGKPPQSFIFRSYIWMKGWDRSAVETMGATHLRPRFDHLQIPEGMLTVNYVGLSLSGSLSKYARDKYPLLKAEGPNDGLTPLADIVAPESLTLIAPASDHFFAEDPQIDRKTVALAKVVISILEEKTTHEARYRPNPN